jgi:hypothetical protein
LDPLESESELDELEDEDDELIGDEEDMLSL